MSGTNEILRGGGFHHVAFRVRDFDKSVAFYTEVLGFVPKIEWGQKPDRGVLLDTGDGNYFELFERPGQAPERGDGVIWHVALRTRDCAGSLERARKAGCKVTRETEILEIPSRPTGPTRVKIAFFQGPDGEEIELFENDAT